MQPRLLGVGLLLSTAALTSGVGYLLLAATTDLRASLIAQSVKNLPAMQETGIQFLDQENPLEKEMESTPVF